MDAAPTAADAARDNAGWCDAVCRSHRLPTTTDRAAWTTGRRSPTLYPDAVTLVPDPPVDELLARTDPSPGCTIKDSFASLDLRPHGFEVLFDARWILRSPPTSSPRIPIPWEVVDSPTTLAEWVAAWQGGDDPSDPFGPGLLRHPDVGFVAERRAGRITAGAVLHRSRPTTSSPDAEVIGVSNLFPADDLAAAWAGCLDLVARRHPGRPVVGYERDEDLDAALAVGFDDAGPLRVWIRR